MIRTFRVVKGAAVSAVFVGALCWKGDLIFGVSQEAVASIGVLVLSALFMEVVSSRGNKDDVRFLSVFAMLVAYIGMHAQPKWSIPLLVVAVALTSAEATMKAGTLQARELPPRYLRWICVSGLLGSVLLGVGEVLELPYAAYLRTRTFEQPEAIPYVLLLGVLLIPMFSVVPLVQVRRRQRPTRRASHSSASGGWRHVRDGITVTSEWIASGILRCGDVTMALGAEYGRLIRAVVCHRRMYVVVLRVAVVFIAAVIVIRISLPLGHMLRAYLRNDQPWSGAGLEAVTQLLQIIGWILLVGLLAIAQAHAVGGTVPKVLGSGYANEGPGEVCYTIGGWIPLIAAFASGIVLLVSHMAPLSIIGFGEPGIVFSAVVCLMAIHVVAELYRAYSSR